MNKGILILIDNWIMDRVPLQLKDYCLNQKNRMSKKSIIIMNKVTKLLCIKDWVSYHNLLTSVIVMEMLFIKKHGIIYLIGNKPNPSILSLQNKLHIRINNYKIIKLWIHINIFRDNTTDTVKFIQPDFQQTLNKSIRGRKKFNRYMLS